MNRDDWQAVYRNQDRILKQLRNLEDEIFLAGGTGLQRFILPISYRYSEDLDFFFPSYRQTEDVKFVGKRMEELIRQDPGAYIDSAKWDKEEKAYRIWCGFDDNEEIIKVELLNFTCCRLKEERYFYNPSFKTENLYNLLLYKLKALCDRPDTIKDLFDLYFILRKLNKINIEELIKDLNMKFECAIGIRYERERIIKALSSDLRWNIEVADEVVHQRDLQDEIECFKTLLKDDLKNSEILDFSYFSQIEKKAREYGLSVEDYINSIDLIETNAFWVDEVTRFFKKHNKYSSPLK